MSARIDVSVQKEHMLIVPRVVAYKLCSSVYLIQLSHFPVASNKLRKMTTWDHITTT